MKCLKCNTETKHYDVYMTYDAYRIYYKCKCGYDWFHDKYRKDEVYYWSERKQDYIKYRGKKTWIK